MTDTALVPIPVEQILLPADLDGSQGRNRAVGRVAQIAATNDLQAIHAWLARFIETKTTFDNYRKETEGRPGIMKNSPKIAYSSELKSEF